MNINIIKQREAILELGYSLNNETFKEYALESLANSWELSNDIKNILGETGKISFESEYNTVDAPSKRIIRVLDEITKLITSVIKTSKVKGFNTNAYIEKGKLTLTAGIVEKEDGSYRMIFTRKTFAKTLKYYFHTFDIDVKKNKNRIDKIEKLRVMVEQELSKSVIKSGKVYISGLPEDILTASHPINGWDSCFSPENSYETTPYGYLKGGKVMVAYFVPEGSNGTVEMKFGDVHKKMWRTWIFITDDGSIAFSDEDYPSYSAVTKTAVINKLKELTGLDYNEDIKVGTCHSLYYDTVYGALTRNGIDKKLNISTDYNKCPITNKLLDRYDAGDQALVDLEALGFEPCGWCDSYRRYGDMNTAISLGDREHYSVCEDCIEEYKYSKHLNAFILDENATDYYDEECGEIQYTYKDILLEKCENISEVKFDSEYTLFIPNYDEELKEHYEELAFNLYGVETSIIKIDKVD